MTVGTALVVVLAALVLVVAVFGLLRRGGGGFHLDAGVPTAASAAQLRQYASPQRPVYWIGPPQQQGKLEVTRTSRGIYVRYLPKGVALGNKSARYTTIATYPLTGAYTSLQHSARSAAFGSARLGDGGLAVWRKSPGTSVYLAYPRRSYLVEVYDPSPQRARSLALSGLVLPVG